MEDTAFRHFVTAMIKALPGHERGWLQLQCMEEPIVFRLEEFDVKLARLPAGVPVRDTIGSLRKRHGATHFLLSHKRWHEVRSALGSDVRYEQVRLPSRGQVTAVHDDRDRVLILPEENCPDDRIVLCVTRERPAPPKPVLFFTTEEFGAMEKDLIEDVLRVEETVK